MPGFKPSGTSLPIASMTAPTSWPGTTGIRTMGFLPKKVLRSEPQKPTYCMRSRTSPAPSSCSGTLSTTICLSAKIFIAFTMFSIIIDYSDIFLT